MWRPPKDQLDVDAYEVRYFVRGGSRNSSQLQLTKKESTTISGLRDRTNYGFEIRTQTASQGKIPFFCKAEGKKTIWRNLVKQ